MVHQLRQRHDVANAPLKALVLVGQILVRPLRKRVAKVRRIGGRVVGGGGADLVGMLDVVEGVLADVDLVDVLGECFELGGRRRRRTDRKLG